MSMACSGGIAVAVAVALALTLAGPPRSALATSAEPDKNPQLDPGPCLAAASANDHDRIVDRCTELIDNEKTDRSDRLKALVARAGAFERKDMLDRAIADYDVVLRLDPTDADIFNARGELWRRKGDRPKAVADFGAALKLNPDHAAARANHKSLVIELERIGVLKAIEGKPSFNCAAARRPVEKAICANPELANLDREVHVSYVRVLQEARDSRDAGNLKREQDEFIARRNARFGKPGYDLKEAMRERLRRLNGIDGY
ncbi:MAG: tetratricopeptide repeat protein [Bradyrhizobium sp.]|uniref:tetratricopeptide repeat protein n=1 Tax=Bradyrhizobium sp. TaxID=376 RepID=UPI003D0DC2A1